MKHFRLFLIALVTIGTVSLGQAQSKVAHISTQQLIESMPEYQSAKSELSKLSNSYTSQIDDMYKELDEKSKKYQNEADQKTDAENEERMQDVQDSRDRILKFQQNAQKELNDKQKEMMEPIIEKAQKTIKKVAEAQGYDYVLDSSEGGGVIVADGKDLLQDVQVELGIE